MNYLTIVLLITLAAACAALAVAWRYEHMICVRTSEQWEYIHEINEELEAENKRLARALATREGESTGRECDALQREMAKRIDSGKGFSIKFGGKAQ